MLRPNLTFLSDLLLLAMKTQPQLVRATVPYRYHRITGDHASDGITCIGAPIEPVPVPSSASGADTVMAINEREMPYRYIYRAFARSMRR